MWFVFPLTPILIAIFVIVFALIGGIQQNLDKISPVLIFLVVLIFVIFAIYNLTRRMTVSRKVCSTIACAMGGGISAFVMNYLLDALAAIEFGIFGVIEFVFVLGVGGGIAGLIILGCICVCFWLGDV